MHYMFSLGAPRGGLISPPPLRSPYSLVPRRSYVRISSYPLLNDTALYREDTERDRSERSGRAGGGRAEGGRPGEEEGRTASTGNDD